MTSSTYVYGILVIDGYLCSRVYGIMNRIFYVDMRCVQLYKELQGAKIISCSRAAAI